MNFRQVHDFHFGNSRAENRFFSPLWEKADPNLQYPFVQISQHELAVLIRKGPGP